MITTDNFPTTADDFNPDNADIWFSWFTPRSRLMRTISRFTGGKTLHNRYYVSVNCDLFRNHNAIFYRQERPLPIAAKPTKQNTRALYINTTTLDGTIDPALNDWVTTACNDRAINAQDLIDKLERNPVADAQHDGTTGVVIATRFKQGVSP